MRKKIEKILFCFRITADLSSFGRLIVNSRRLRKSKSDGAMPQTAVTDFYNFKFGSKIFRIALRRYAGDIDIFYEIFFKQVYAASEKALIDPVTIVDLGANIGLSTLYFHVKYPAATILCVEPDKYNYALLCKNLQPLIENNIVLPVEAAAGEKAGDISFQTVPYGYNSHVQMDNEISNSSYKVQALTVPQLFSQFNINAVALMKIDIEGAEKYIFRDSGWLAKVKNLLIEIHSEEDDAICRAAFRLHNFQVTAIDAPGQNDAGLFRATAP